jgi:hypothetical protein
MSDRRLFLCCFSIAVLRDRTPAPGARTRARRTFDLRLGLSQQPSQSGWAEIGLRTRSGGKGTLGPYSTRRPGTSLKSEAADAAWAAGPARRNFSDHWGPPFANQDARPGWCGRKTPICWSRMRRCHTTRLPGAPTVRLGTPPEGGMRIERSSLHFATKARGPTSFPSMTTAVRSSASRTQYYRRRELVAVTGTAHRRS